MFNLWSRACQAAASSLPRVSRTATHGIRISPGWQTLRPVFAVSTISAGFCALSGASLAEEEDKGKEKAQVEKKRRLIDNEGLDFFRPVAYLFGLVYDKFFPPETKMLLPQALPDEWGGVKRTLVVELEETLVKTKFMNEVYKIKIRPEATSLLAKAAELGFEIVVFSVDPAAKVDSVLPSINKQQLVEHRLYQEQCTYKNGKYVKDLSRLNRDLSKVVLLDCNPSSWEYQPENALPVTRFKGKADSQLIEAEILLEQVQKNGIEDVREVLAKYHAGDSFEEMFGAEVGELRESRVRAFRQQRKQNKKNKKLGLVPRGTRRIIDQIMVREQKKAIASSKSASVKDDETGEDVGSSGFSFGENE